MHIPGRARVNHHLVLLALTAALFLGSTCSLFNKPPSAPVISGPSAGIVGVPVEFTATATDPDGDSVAYQFAWGDGDTSDWDSFVASGETTSVEHAYSDSGECTVRARAQDKNGGESGWSAGHVLRFISAGPAYPDSICDSLYLGGGSSTRCCISPDGSLVAVGSSSSRDSVSILRVADRTLLPRVRVAAAVGALVFSGDNRYLYAGSGESYALYRVDVVNRRVVDSLLGVGSARTMLFTPDGNRLLVSASQFVHVIRPDSLAKLDSVILPYNASRMVLNRAGTTLYVGTYHGLSAVDVDGCSLLASTQAVDLPQHVVLSPDEESLYVNSVTDSGVTVLRTSDLSVTRRVNMGIIAAGHLALTPDGAYLYVGNGYEGSLVCDTRTLMPVDTVDVPGLGGLVFHPGGDTAYYASGSKLYVIGKRH